MSDIKNFNASKKEAFKSEANLNHDNEQHYLKGSSLRFVEFYNDIVNSAVHFACNVVKVAVNASTRLVALYALQILIGYYNQQDVGFNHNILDHVSNIVGNGFHPGDAVARNFDGDNMV